MARAIEFFKAHRKLRRWLIGVASAVLLYTLIGFLLLPCIARSLIQSKLTETLGRATTVEKVRFNPYSLVLEVEKLAVAGAGSPERFAGFDLLRVKMKGRSKPFMDTLESEFDLELMRLIDEQYTRTPFYGSRRMAMCLRGLGLAVNHKRVQRLMQLMGIEAVYPKRRLSANGAEHKVFPSPAAVYGLRRAA